MVKILVIGAGVSGLTTALELKRRNPNYKIAIIAKDLPGDIVDDYTSPFAGANWHSFAGKDDKVLQAVDTIAYKRLMYLAENDPMCGIHVSDCHIYDSEYTVAKTPIWEDPWFKTIVKQYQRIPDLELPTGVGRGYKYKGLVITPSTYLHYMYLKCLSLGISITRVPEINDISESIYLFPRGKNPADLVINCTGLGSSKIKGFKDTNKTYGIRGQILHVRNNLNKQFILSPINQHQESMNESLYVFPRKEGGCIIGGCFLKNYENTMEDPDLTKRLIKMAEKYVPELLGSDDDGRNFGKKGINPPKIDIIKVLVGQRPARDGGFRVEIDSDHPWLIHNYGIGGLGYQSSFGLSARVCQLVRKALSSNL